ncbi:MAG: alpha/beta hydrolase [Bacteroidales bacterium]|nr:alpha/beta hydrolase [Bacteroidales bacterium]
MKLKALVFCLLLICFGQIFAQESIPLWEGFDVSHGKQVTLTPYLAENNVTGLSVIVCPGGSYYWLDDETEGDGVAQWLQSNGISAFVLRYRAAGFGAFFWHHRIVFRGKQYPDMISDAQRALQWVREHAKEYHINPEKVGMMGFSAGGHLVMSAACFNAHDYLKANGIDTDVNLRPDFVCPIYPVVTMREPYVHKRSRRALLSEKRNHDLTMIDSLSLERHIPANCPPVFIVNCVDDPVVEYHNSVLLDSALTANQVNHRYIQYQTGGHGFGASEEKGTAECRQWKNEFLNWIRSLNLESGEGSKGRSNNN